VGLVVLIAAGPTLVMVLDRLIPVVLVTATSLAVVRLVWFYTQRW
jgi:hypothetical protein